MNTILLAYINIKKNFQNAKELKSAFITSILGMFLNNIVFIFLWYYFGVAVGNINGWNPIDIVGMYIFCHSSFGIVNSLFCGINNIPRYISTGSLDRFLLTPKNILVKIATSQINTSALGDLLFGIMCLIIYANIIEFTMMQILISILFLMITSIVTFSFTLISMTFAFYFMDGESISEGILGSFLTPSLYQGGAFNGILRIIFTFFIPSLLVGAIPLEIVKNLNIESILFLIGSSIFWLIISVIFFYKSLKKYESNNFLGFGN